MSIALRGMGRPAGQVQRRVDSSGAHWSPSAVRGTPGHVIATWLALRKAKPLAWPGPTPCCSVTLAGDFPYCDGRGASDLGPGGWLLSRDDAHKAPRPVPGRQVVLSWQGRHLTRNEGPPAASRGHSSKDVCRPVGPLPVPFSPPTPRPVSFPCCPPSLPSFLPPPMRVFGITPCQRVKGVKVAFNKINAT